MGACTEELAVYDSVGACLAVCAGLPEGSPGDEIGNTVQCRLHEASLASQLIASERTANCARSGPIGSGTCGANCEGYCVLMNEFCAAGFETEFQTLAGCIAACTALPDLGTYDLSMNSGDSVQCRAWHVTFAAIAPTDHCVHAAGALPCAD